MERNASFVWRLLVAVIVTPLVGQAQFTGAAHTCTWDRTPRPGAVVALRAAPRLPCRLEVRATGPTLRTSDTSQAFGFAGNAARDRSGRFYTSYKERISLWSAEGALLRGWGRRGQGPGEFGAGLKEVYVASGDRLVVQDGPRAHWFDRDGSFVQTLSFDRLVFDEDATVFLDDGRMVVSERLDDDNTIHILNLALENGPTGKVRSFAPLRAAETGVVGTAQRALAKARADRIWAGPPFMTRRGYEIELMDLNGRVIQTLTRSVDWFPSGGRPVTSRAERPPTSITKLHVDDRGLLYVFAVAVGPEWAPNTSPADFAMVRVEVIDPVAGMVLASTPPAKYTELLKLFPPQYFTATNVGYQSSTDGDDQPILTMKALTLVPNR